MNQRIKTLFFAGAIAVAAGVPARAEIEIQEVTSPGGITAWLYEEHSIPILAIEASFQGGAVLDSEGKEGAVSLMMGLLEEGAADRDATAFSEAREAIAARFSFSSSRDEVSVSATMLTEFRDESIALLASALNTPRFDEAAFTRVQAQMVSGLRSDETDPNSIVGDAFYARAFEGHPYARPTDGRPETVASLGVEDMRAAHRDALVRDRLKVAVVGDITAEELGPVLDALFGDLPESGPPLPTVVEPLKDGSVEVIDLDIPQSVVMFGQPGIPRDDPDFVPAFVMDHILGGGGFGSRLTEELREKRGLTYGIYTWLAPGDFGAVYAGRFSSANERVAEAIDLVRAEWQRIATEGVSEAELEAAKRYLTGAYPLRFSSNARIAGQLLGLQAADLDRSYVNERNELVEAVTMDDIRRVADRLLAPDLLSWTIVGRPVGVEATN